jgi:hypothetical protein
VTATSLDILVRARDEASRVINGVTASGEKLDGTLSRTSKTTGRLGGFFSSAAGKLTALVGGAFAAKKAFDFGADAIRNAEDAKRSMGAFHASLQRTGQTASINESKFNDWLQSMGESIGKDDEDLRDLSTSLTSAFDFSKLKGDATKNLMAMTSSIQDVSAATGKSASLIKRAFLTLANDPAAAITQFQKLGVITEAQAEHFKAMAKKGKDAAVTQKILTLTGKQYGGAAAANTTASAKLATIWENMKESLGNFLLPLFEKGVNLLSRFVSWFRDAASAVQQGSGAFGSLSGIFDRLIAIGTKVWSFFKDDLLGVWNALVDVYKKDLQPALQSLWDAMKALEPISKVIVIVYIALQAIILKLALKALPIVIKVLGFLIKIIAKVIEWVARFIARAVRVGTEVVKGFIQLYQGVANWIGRTVAFVTDKWNRIVDFFRGIGRKLAAAGRGMWDWLSAGVKAAVNTVIGWLNAAIDFINKFQVHIHINPPGPGSINFDWNGPQIPHIPTLARGGITMGPTLALIGDNPGGREAVIPLPANGRLGAGARVFIDRRRFVDQGDFEVVYRGY